VYFPRLLFAMLRRVPQQDHGIARFPRHALHFAASAGLAGFGPEKYEGPLGSSQVGWK
jgi:hypothetical protein